ncbi:hypothetical protein E2P81_ATG07825 [Venturia nashicola]|nr:hypothetical protein E2P81_ATG07825 [Venturia nashicola]
MASSMLDALYNHLVFPYRLPGVQDSKLAHVESALLERLHSTAVQLLAQVPEPFRSSYAALQTSLQACRSIHINRRLDRRMLSEELLNLQPDCILILHITEQNSGLLIWRKSSDDGEHVIFEAFEAAPRSEDVLSADGALQWDFPGSAVAVPMETYLDANFHMNLARHLEQASREQIHRFKPFTRKAGQDIVEERQTADPGLITNCFVTILEALGRHAPEVPQIRKRVHDDVCWNDGARLPFRRLPLWLVLRVGLRRMFYILFGDEAGRAHYKFFMAVVLSDLLSDILRHSNYDYHKLAVLNAKLARKLSKFEEDKAKAPTSLRETYDAFFNLSSPHLLLQLEDSSSRVHGPWNEFKRANHRFIPRLPRKIYGNMLHGQNPFYLTLPASWRYLQGIPTGGAHTLRGVWAFRTAQNKNSEPEVNKADAFTSFVSKYRLLADRESNLSQGLGLVPATKDDCADQCVEISHQIEGYIDYSQIAYGNNPEQMSISILLLMELWKEMDQCALRAFPLLQKFNPGFPLHLLNVLLLPKQNDMYRLQRIQDYLFTRHEQCGNVSATIFDDPSPGCFAALYYDRSPKLQQIHASIESEYIREREEKLAEQERVKAEYDSLLEEIAGLDCTTLKSDCWPFDVFHNERKCEKCLKDKQARCKRIEPLEHPLSRDLHEAKAAIFELDPPHGFSNYRDASWSILSRVARAASPGEVKPTIFLREYSQLRAFATSKQEFRFCLASRTKITSHTHRNTAHVCGDLRSFFVNCGLQLHYYDNHQAFRNWVSTTKIEPSFAHHCKLVLSGSSPLSNLITKPDSKVVRGLSSNQVLASEPDCPANLNVHEFLAFQSLFGPAHCRWEYIIAQLGSSTLNFSSETISSVIQHLATEVGIVNEEDPSHHLRAAHSIFEDYSFCLQLINQIEARLSSLTLNWREVHCMDMIITLLLRIHSLSPPAIATQAIELIEDVRSTLLGWSENLTQEIRAAANDQVVQDCSKYLFQAALLGRRTFSTFVDIFDILEGQDGDMTANTLLSFISFSIALQNSLPTNPETISIRLKNALVEDTKLVHSLRTMLRASLQNHPECLSQALNTVWPMPSRECSDVSFPPHDDWVKMQIRSNPFAETQTVSFHLTDGHLLVNNQTLGRLSDTYRKSPIICELFGDAHLQVFTSDLPGMTHVLTMNQNGYSVHVGTRNGATIVRAFKGSTLLELVPREEFCSGFGSDLPLNLINECFHWFNVVTRVVEIRKKHKVWFEARNNWFLNCTTRIAERNKGSRLIDPHSELSKKVARIFEGFENPGHITVYQPPNGHLMVELRRLELVFRVGNNYLLESPSLKFQIDENQDAGCIYGLRSSLVVRDKTNSSNRAVLVPTLVTEGVTSSKRGIHPTVWFEPSGSYVKYQIDKVLGRLTGAMDPSIQYQLALMHAVTSFIIPDDLTGQTGSEQALKILRSAQCQPHIPLPSNALVALNTIAQLSPSREFYPPDLQSMQKATFKTGLSLTIQRDEFRLLVENLYQISDSLVVFHVTTAQQTKLANPHLTGPESQLTRRAIIRRAKFERPNAFSEKIPPTKEYRYKSRHVLSSSSERCGIFEIVNLIRRWPSKLAVPQDLASMLEQCEQLGGFQRLFDPTFSINTCVNARFGLEFGSVVEYCKKQREEDKYNLVFSFALFRLGRIDVKALKTWLAFAFLEDLKSLDVLNWRSYTHFRQNQTPTINLLVSILNHAAHPVGSHEIATLSRPALNAMMAKREDRIKSDSTELAKFFMAQWPSEKLPAVHFVGSTMLDVAKALRLVEGEWLRLYQNFQLAAYVVQVQEVLNNHFCQDPPIDLPIRQLPETLAVRLSSGHLIIDLTRDLVGKPGPDIPTIRKEVTLAPRPNGAQVLQASSPIAIHGKPTSAPKMGNFQHEPQKRLTAAAKSFDPRQREISELDQIIEKIAASDSAVRKAHAQSLKVSLEAYSNAGQKEVAGRATATASEISGILSEARSAVDQKYSDLCMAFEAEEPRAQWLKAARLWPCTSTYCILETLRSISGCSFGAGMKEALVDFGTALGQLQRALRMEDALQKTTLTKVAAEQKNKGHGNWRPIDHPDWLLFELDANLLLRGEGKTSCILPTIAAFLADGDNLVRIIVPKSLIPQTSSLLLSHIGGLVGRPLRNLPFSRKTDPSLDTINRYIGIHKSIRKAQGVMVCAPGHILSFQLCGIQRLSDLRQEEASAMIRGQEWLDSHARSVIDESDDVLSIRTALVYPSGSLSLVDGGSQRWQTAEEVLTLVRNWLPYLQERFPHSVEVISRSSGGFPFIFFLKTEVENELISGITTQIYSGRTNIMPVRDFTNLQRKAIKIFISQSMVPQQIVDEVRGLFSNRPELRKRVMLLRGLLVHRILLHTLKKRWYVEYGIDTRRDPIAVPFTSRGVASEQSEYGHPDSAILFTILATYYTGLTVSQVRENLEAIAKHDNPGRAYEQMIQSSSNLIDALRDYDAINTDDPYQVSEIHRAIAFDTTAVDFYLNTYVFPRHAKQFSTRLQASGWDLPTTSITNPKARLTTGFSGTNDTRDSLPLGISQHDLPSLVHTSAEVLSYFLQPRNRRYEVLRDINGRRLPEIGMLRKLNQLSIRVLIDTGATILEMSNSEVARNWLDIDTEANAAVYFDSQNRAIVLFRQGKSEQLAATPFAEDLTDLIVYIDHSHSRGIDMKLPANARAAVTLGVSLQKDALVQGAMRCRQLSTTQSVTFFAPLEVHNSILDLNKLGTRISVDSSHVVHWLLESTCQSLESLFPLFYSMGEDYCRRTNAQIAHPTLLNDPEEQKAYLKIVRQTEKKTLEDFYEPNAKSKAGSSRPNYTPAIAAFMKNLNQRRKAYQDNCNAVHGSALVEVEQEREVQVEVNVQQVRNLQRPPRFPPMRYGGLNKDIIAFVETGFLRARSDAYEQAFEAMQRSKIGKKFGISKQATQSPIFTTTEFSRTVLVQYDRPCDSYIRPVQFLLYSTLSETALLVCPEEAERLIHICRRMEDPRVHLVNYVPPVTKRMLANFGNLDFHSTPPIPAGFKAPTWLTVQLGLIAGRLYFEWHEYQELRHFLGLTDDDLIDGIDSTEIDDDSSSEEGLAVTEDDEVEEGDAELSEPTKKVERSSGKRIVSDGSRSSTGKEKIYKFTAKPRAFLLEWTAMRRKQQDIAHSPVGFVAHGKALEETHSFFTKHSDSETVQKMAMVGSGEEVKEEEEDLDDDEYMYADLDVEGEEYEEFEDANEYLKEEETISEKDGSEDEEKRHVLS